MSYNVHDLLDDSAAAARVVRAVDPDVLCLQEVPRRLTTELRLPRFARECRLLWRGGRLGTGGTAVLTAPRVVVHDGWRGRLPVRFPDRTRGYAAASVSLGGDGSGTPELTVVSVHLGLKAPERLRHAALVLEGLGDRAVVAGDLNEGPGGTAYDLIAARLPLASAGTPTFPARRPAVALDAIFAGRDLRVVPPDDGRDGPDGRGDGVDEHDLVAGSDHRPVWVDLDLTPR
ncbi:endonuclease/exonuclease/phosphatase family protein [Terrabacter tumescens]|nr:endonuclease/exonuclease/phosphatase family protein [Terrabacter tumescens]